ncbi:MAG TPA: tetratricopeptide repeat protein [Bacteroides sp.]|nr:tetratricopeptide repeat protein [Bacteroides sp.]
MEILSVMKPKIIKPDPGLNPARNFRQFILAAALMILIPSLASAQEFAEIKDAFQNSYIQEATGEIHAAINSLKSVYDEKSYELNLRLGWLSYQAGNFTESTAYYNKAIDLMPYAVEPRFGVVYPGAAMGNWSMVMNQYERILEITPNNSVAMHRVGLIHYGREDYEKARQYFEKVVNLYPFDYDALTMLAWSHFKLQNLREAKVLFQKALLNTPSGSSALEGLELLE